MDAGRPRSGGRLHSPHAILAGQFLFMNVSGRFSFARLWAMVVKESIQLRRDRMTAAMIFGIPLMQILLFGFVIDTDPRHMPAALHLQDDGPYGRALVAGLKNSTYYDFQYSIHSEEEGRRLLSRGKVQFVVTVPADFTRELL